MNLHIRCLSYLALFLVTTSAQSTTSQEIFPMHSGVSWSYQSSGGSHTITILDQKHNVNGVLTTANSYSDGSIEYYTNDSNGLRLHKLASPGDFGTDTIIFNPPVQLIDRNVIVGGSFVSNGTATATYPGYGVADVSYTANADIIDQENITVIAGKYEHTYHMRYRITLFANGDSETLTVNHWLAPGVGRVKRDATDSDGTKSAQLTSATIPVTSPTQLFWHHAITGETRLYELNGPAITSETNLNTVSDINWAIAGTGDFDGDGEKDIFWRNGVTGENRIDFMKGATVLNNTPVNTVADTGWNVAGIADFNGDKKDDILWHHSENGRVWMYLMDGTTIVDSQHVAFTALDWQIKETGDYDGDGRGDILWRNSTHGRVWMYLMNGISIHTNEHVAFSGADWDIQGTGDFNSDGKDDILWRNSLTGLNWLYTQNGTKIEINQAINTLADLNWEVVATEDFDNDNLADILWRNRATGDDMLYQMNGTIVIDASIVNQVPDLNWEIVK